MPGGIDQVQFVILTVLRLIVQCDGAGLDGDAALLLDIHVVEHLLLHLALGNGIRKLQKAVGKRALAVVDVRDDRKVSDVGLLFFHISPVK